MPQRALLPLGPQVPLRGHERGGTRHPEILGLASGQRLSIRAQNRAALIGKSKPQAERGVRRVVRDAPTLEVLNRGNVSTLLLKVAVDQTPRRWRRRSGNREQEQAVVGRDHSRHAARRNRCRARSARACFHTSQCRTQAGTWPADQRLRRECPTRKRRWPLSRRSLRMSSSACSTCRANEDSPRWRRAAWPASGRNRRRAALGKAVAVDENELLRVVHPACRGRAP